jgi:hypothetical protein
LHARRLVEKTLDMADQHLDLPWNVCRTEVYSGTALKNRLESEGRLEGDYRSYGYLMRDERAEVMFRILRVSLHERALEIESLLNRLISLSFSRQLHQHFFPGEASDELGRAIIELGVAVRRDTVKELRRTLAFVVEQDVRDQIGVRRFAVEQALAINARDQAWRKQSGGPVGASEPARRPPDAAARSPARRARAQRLGRRRGVVTSTRTVSRPRHEAPRMPAAGRRYGYLGGLFRR